MHIRNNGYKRRTIPLFIDRVKLSMLSCLSGFLSIAIAIPALAQVTPDGTTSTTVNSTPTGVQIDNGDRAGGNLFHSFGEFSIPTGSEAYFNNTNDIVNIFSRVTGGNISNIDGLLRANGTANLFLINPAGILLGENASLQLGGSFYGSTADSIVFNNGEFSATDLENPPLITINAPIGLGFRDNPGGIVNQSVANEAGLQVSSGNTLALVGGNIRFTGGLIKAPGANIELGGLTEAGIVTINENGSLSFSNELARANISLNDASVVDAIGDGGGSITVNANNLEIFNGSQLLAGILPGTQLPEAQAGDIVVNATEKVTINNQDRNVATGIDSSAGDITDLFTQGSPGNISINTKILQGNGFFAIGSSNNGEGNVGDVKITATESISLIGREGLGSGLASIVGFSGTGDGGNIRLTTPSLTISDASIATTTLGVGNAGDIQIEVTDSLDINGVSQLQAASGSGGNAGNIIISGENADLALNGGELIITTLVASIESLLTDNPGLSPETIDILESLGFSNTVGSQGGDIIINARNLTADNNVSVRTSTAGEASAERLANAGNIEINVAKNLTFSNNSELASETGGQGNAGNISLTVGDAISFNDTSFISTAVRPKLGDLGVDFDQSLQGGDINITSRSLSLNNGSQINASTFDFGDGGQITLNVSELVEIRGINSNTDSGIFSAVSEDAIGNGGEIKITTKNLLITDGAFISTSTLGQGDVGKISITANDSITIDGQTSNGNVATGISNDIGFDAVGDNNELEITTSNLSLRNLGLISTSSFGQGNGGTLSIAAKTFNLDRAVILAVNQPSGSSTSDESPIGGNIDLEVNDNITLRNNSVISAEAGNNAIGGNVDINTDFIVTYPSRDGNGNDIRASAEEARGGDIDITAEALFGIEQRQATNNNATNDIDASSQVAGLDGTVSINTPGSNPLRENIEQTQNVVVSTVETTDACSVSETGVTSGLVVKGKGGVPPEPSEPLDAEVLIVDEEATLDISDVSQNNNVGTFPGTSLQEENFSFFNPNYIPPGIQPVAYDDNGKPMYLARGVIVQEDGTAILTAYPTNNIESRTVENRYGCN
jgi:filamentous hemagglutinin family protein